LATAAAVAAAAPFVQGEDHAEGKDDARKNVRRRARARRHAAHELEGLQKVGDNAELERLGVVQVAAGVEADDAVQKKAVSNLQRHGAWVGA
jgi:hypothetical protein